MVEFLTKDTHLWAKHFPDKLYNVLAFLSKREQEVELSQLKKEFRDQMSKPVINEIIFDLKMQKFIEEEKMKDKRKKKVILTNDGRALYHKLQELSEIL